MNNENTGYNFHYAENFIKEKWKNGKYFEKLIEKNKDGERFRFLDGPITANNAMGIHHAFGRTLKDITIKYNSMNGKSYQYQNGFDAQGLWVEVEVEKKHNFKDKNDIIEFGMDKFTDACLDRVDRFSKIITEQSVDLGQWMDWDNSYFTNSDDNILGIWHFLKVCDDKGWIVKKKRVMSWCPRCGTSLSEHEMSGNYKMTTHDSVFFKMPLINEDADLLLWTTTPWTLTSNAATAVNPELDYVYVKVKSSDRTLICGKNVAKKIIKSDFVEIVKTVKGSELIDKEYHGLFPELEVQNFKHRVIPWKDVQDDEGTGLVHIAPGCGNEDFELGIEHGLPAICPIDESGVILAEFGKFAGQKTDFVKDDVFNELRANDNMYYIMEYEHKYPSCWRCKTDIVFKLVDEWYIKSDEIRPKMLEAVETVEWQPIHVKKRMIDWLNNMSDWNISRKRFYGLPLPFYVCDSCGKTHVIGSLEELNEKSDQNVFDELHRLHRPWIDSIMINCDCGEQVKRIPEVGDCWLDAGIAPFVTKGYFTDRKCWEENFPNEVVIEMIEQVRLWFYSLLFMSVALVNQAPYEKVIAYGSVVREDGEKFSKSAGKDKNIVLGDAIDILGADTIRYIYASTTSTNDVRFGYSLGDDSKKRLLAFWNTYTFFDVYSSIDKPQLENYTPNFEDLDLNDKWLIRKINSFIENANKNYSQHMYQPIIKSFEMIIDDINNWYIRVNRRRFWKGEAGTKKIAYWTLYNAIKTIIKIMAPITPFMTDFIWHKMVRKFEANEVESVHLSSFPSEFNFEIPVSIENCVSNARDIISVTQKMRNNCNLMVKQPLSELILFVDNGTRNSVREMDEIIKSEINVKELIFGDDMKQYQEIGLSVNFGKAGAVFKKDVNRFKEYLAKLSQEETNHLFMLLSEKEFVEIDEFDEKISLDLINVCYDTKQNYSLESFDNNTVILNTEITKDLKVEFLVRTLIRKLQVMRKDNAYDIDSRINITYSTLNEDLIEIITENQELIKSELLVNELKNQELGSDTETIQIDGEKIKIKLDICS